MKEPLWHPLLAADERSPGRWVMVDSLGHEYGSIELVRRGPELGYKATDVRGELVGYFTNLRAATVAVHAVFLRSHGAPEFQGYPAMNYRADIKKHPARE